MKALQPVPDYAHDDLDFELPPKLEAAEPPEARGLGRDGVRLLASYRGNDRVDHAGFRDLPDLLEPGDLLVVNTSGTMNAALPATRADGSPLTLHLSTRLPADLWTVELRTHNLEPLFDGKPGRRSDCRGAPGPPSTPLFRRKTVEVPDKGTDSGSRPSTSHSA